jgi:TolA-binding protein
MLEDAVRRAREREVPWNELRQAGTLRRIEKARAAGSTRPARRAPFVVLVAACAVVTSVVLWRTHAHHAVAPTAATTAGTATTTAPNPPQANETVLRLADGSIARQAEGAAVQVQAVEDGRAELLQTQGSVRYEVVPNARRRFVVRARDVNVNVLGTVFRVDVQPLAVTVRVERGQVEVAQLDRRVRLDAGEGITFETSDAPSESVATSGAASAEAPRRMGPGAPQQAGRPSAPSPQSRDRTAEAASPLRLLDDADRARAAGDLDGAVRALEQLLQRYPNDRRVALAEFMLGRVESARGASTEAARAFGACLAHGAAGALGEDALAEWARAQQRSGDAPGAVAAARRYLATYPGGVHRRAMQRLADGEN